MQLKYTRPEAEIILFEVEDIMSSSGGSELPVIPVPALQFNSIDASELQ